MATVLSLRNTTLQREHPLATIAETGSQSDKVGLSISGKDERFATLCNVIQDAVKEVPGIFVRFSRANRSIWPSPVFFLDSLLT